MNPDPNKTVRDLAVEIPNATRIFEQYGIDFCCGGKKPLSDACREKGLALLEVTAALKAAAKLSNEPTADLQGGSLAALIDHIVKTHHGYTREEIVRLQTLLDKVCSKHGGNHSELRAMQAIFAGLAQELKLHLMKEENVLFPYVIRMEESVLQDEPILPPPFGTVQNPVRMMVQEHDGAGNALRELRQLSADYTPPEDACTSFRVLYKSLEAFEKDLHQHIHLENNILFPRALEMERQRESALIS